MKRRQELQARSAFVLTFRAMLLATPAATASDHHGDLTEEFHQTYTLTPTAVLNSTTSTVPYTSPHGSESGQG